jgi:hypothetical protein
MDQDNLRVVVWDLYCPRCLHPSPRYRLVGTEQSSRTVSCSSCGKPFIVNARIDGQGAACCSATPVFIRAPELVEDSDPSPTYR